MPLNPLNSYLCDTTFFSDLLDGSYSDITQADFLTLATGQSGYSLITLAEIYAKRLSTEDTIYRNRLLSTFKCYPLTEEIAKQAGEYRRHFVEQHKLKLLRRRDDVPGLPDCLIAATARAHDLIWFTRDARHAPKFRRFDLSVQVYTLQT